MIIQPEVMFCACLETFTVVDSVAITDTPMCDANLNFTIIFSVTLLSSLVLASPDKTVSSMLHPLK
jgi:hypothetical protein